jgi:hypothetical protein
MNGKREKGKRTEEREPRKRGAFVSGVTAANREAHTASIVVWQRRGEKEERWRDQR